MVRSLDMPALRSSTTSLAAGPSADVRRNEGHQHYLTAFSGKAPVGGWLRTMIRCIRGDLASTVKSYFAYCRLTDLPILLALLVYARPFEWQGATMAKNGMKLVEGTSYR